MSKKLLKARYSFSGLYPDKPLSVVEPLKVKSLSDLLQGGCSDESSIYSKCSAVPSEGSPWEYKPWVPPSRQCNLGASGVQSSFASSMSSSLPNAGPPDRSTRKKQSLNVICDSDSEYSSSSNWSSSLDPKSPSSSTSSRPPSEASVAGGLKEDLTKQPLVFQRRSPPPAISQQDTSDLISNKRRDYALDSPRRQQHGCEAEKATAPRKRKKEDNLLPRNCKFSRFEIVDAPIDTFNKLLEKMPNEDKIVFKDSRRKGKNRGAARRARDRRICQHDQLIKQKELALKELSCKKQDLKNLENECQIWAKLVDTINYHIRALETKLKKGHEK